MRHELQQELEEALLGPVQHMSADHRPDYNELRMSQAGGRDSQDGHHAQSGGWQVRGSAELQLHWSSGQMSDLTGCILLLLAWRSSLARVASTQIEQSNVLLAGRARQPRLNASAVAELVLPFTAGLLLTLLDAASKHPAVAAVALCSLALAQPCLINTGDQALTHCYVKCSIELAPHTCPRTVMCKCLVVW